MNRSLWREPSAVIALAMALGAFGVVFGHAAVYGRVHEVDEGTPAHLFQLLMVAQAPFVLFFLMKWLPDQPKQALQFLALQVAIIVAAFAGIYFFT